MWAALSQGCRLQIQEMRNVNLLEFDTISAIVSKVNLVGNTVEWIMDTCATKYICADRRLFQSYEKIGVGGMFLWVAPYLPLSLKKRRLL